MPCQDGDSVPKTLATPQEGWRLLSLTGAANGPICSRYPIGIFSRIL